MSQLMATIFLLCSSSFPGGYYDNGLYIPTHVTACVDFCRPHKGVQTLTTLGDPLSLLECLCWDSSVKYIAADPYNQDWEDYQ